MRGRRKRKNEMKKIEMEQIFSPRIGWDRECRGECEDGVWGEYIDGDKPADGKPLPAGSVAIRGGFQRGQAIMAIKDGHVVDVVIAYDCTRWDDPSTGGTYAPDDGEVLVIVGYDTEPDFVARTLCADHEKSYDPEARGDTLASPRNWGLWPAANLRRIGAWRDADARNSEAAKEIKAAKKAAYDRLVAEANATWGRYADRLLRAHLAGGWTREIGVQAAVWELVRVPKVVDRLREEPGGTRMLRVLDKEFAKPKGPDTLIEALRALTGPRMERAVIVAACILGC